MQAAFLTLACNLSCSYCINLHEAAGKGRSGHGRPLKGDEWIAALNRIATSPQRPITLQGGEPTLHKYFYDILAGVDDGTYFDLLTNMQFDADEFVRRVPTQRFSRIARYAPIRVSYHPGQNDMGELISKSKILTEGGFKVGIYGVLHPDQRDEILGWQEQALDIGIDFRTKEFLGVEGDDVHGTYRYPGAMEGQSHKYCLCKTTELLLSPSGSVFRCHSDLYEGRRPIGHVLDADFVMADEYRQCFYFGHCNPCDVKVKTNRHQEFGHTSVSILNIHERRQAIWVVVKLMPLYSNITGSDAIHVSPSAAVGTSPFSRRYRGR